MTAPQVDSRFDMWERRLEAVSRVVPYILLAASTLLAVLPGDQPRAAQLETLGLAALAAAWMLWMVNLHPAWVERTALMAVYFAGLLALIALLMQRSTWFGLFAFTGYLHAWRFLPGKWRVVGVTLTAVLSVTWQAGGFPQPTVPAVLSYLLIVVITVTLVSVFSYMGEITSEQNRLRKQVIAELARANRRLEETLAENAGLQAQVLEQARQAGILDERQRMAGEIHDTLAQNLTGIITQLEAAERSSRNLEQRRRHVDQARALARESLDQARRSVRALRPAPLETVPLGEAVAALAERWSETSEIALRVEITGSPQPLLPEIENTLFRVAQEALANAAKHSRASRVGLTLSYMEDVVLLDVRDDGVGFDVDRLKTNGRGNSGSGFGLQLMEQRLRRVAGVLQVESALGEGTAINARVPAIRAGDEG